MKIFISYAHADRSIAGILAKILDQHKISYFRYERDIRSGDNIRNRIQEGFVNCTHLVSLVSPASLQSSWVSYEAGYAEANRLRVMPYLVHEATRMPDFFQGLLYIKSKEEFEQFFQNEINKPLDKKIVRILLDHHWRLIYRPPNGLKSIRFGENETLIEGGNDNESFWRIKDGKLEILRIDRTTIHSRFVFHDHEMKFYLTNDNDLKCVRGQIIELAN